MILGGLVYLLSIASLFTREPLSDAALIVVIFLSQIGQVVAKYRAIHWFGFADSLRRMQQLEDGLGVKPTPLRLAEAQKTVGICEGVSDSGYWHSKSPVGPRRLVEMLEESAFYTEDLSQKCGLLLIGISLVGASICVTSLLYATRIGVMGKASEVASHIVVASLAFFLAGDTCLLGLQYFELRASAHSALQEARYLLSRSGVSHEEAIAFAMEYNSAVAQAPPLISAIHAYRRTRLDALFNSYKSLCA